MSKRKKAKRKAAAGTPQKDRPLWTPYYQRVTRNKKKYTRKQKHKKDYRDE
ncbi:MAG: hypothetical protein IKX83_04940 [Clostridia bacterium]|nr:hypothetical protein [Clostridia bacterium]